LIRAEPTYEELGYSNAFIGWIGENMGRSMVDDARLVQQGGVGDDLLVTSLLVTEFTAYIDPTPISDGLNAGLLVVDGRYAEALVSVGGMLVPGALARVGDLPIMKKLDDFVPPLTVDTKKLCPDSGPNCFVAGTLVVMAEPNTHRLALDSENRNELFYAIGGFVIAVGLGVKPQGMKEGRRRRRKSSVPLSL
jgi:hypothetical protein